MKNLQEKIICMKIKRFMPFYNFAILCFRIMVFFLEYRKISLIYYPWIYLNMVLFIYDLVIIVLIYNGNDDNDKK